MTGDVGRAGSGLTTDTARNLWRQLEAMRRLKMPGEGTPSPATRRNARWVEPELVAEVEYRGMTSDGKLRHPVFKRIVDSGS